MILHSGIQGEHWPNGGKGITLEDLYQWLRTVPRKARENYVTGEDGKDLIGFSFGQSSEAEKWEFKVHLVLERDAQP
jgi:hypothetical protein